MHYSRVHLPGCPLAITSGARDLPACCLPRVGTTGEPPLGRGCNKGLLIICACIVFVYPILLGSGSVSPLAEASAVSPPGSDKWRSRQDTQAALPWLRKAKGEGES